MAQAFYPPPHEPRPSHCCSDLRQLGRATLSRDGLHELAAPSRYSPTITRWLVVSYTTFSPLPLRREAVVLFYRHLLSPIASTFRSGAPCAARTFLSCHYDTSDRPWQCFQSAKVRL